MKSRTAIYRVAASMFAVFTLAACGQKGPLYLPDTGGEVVTRPAGATQSTPQQQPQQQPTQQPAPEATPQPPPNPQSTTPKPDEKKNPPPR